MSDLNKIFTFLFVITVTVDVAQPAQFKPDWVSRQPHNREYYIGIGFSEKNDVNKDYARQAKNNALNELASEITINISSEIVDVITVQSGLSATDFRSEVQSSTKASLEGYELVDMWEDDREYWVYYRLSKVEYERRKREKLEKALNLSKDLFFKAKERERQSDPAESMILYKQSFAPIQNYLGESLLTEYEGSKIYLQNEIYSSLQSLLGRIDLRAVKSNLKGKVGRPLSEPVSVRAVYISPDGKERGVQNLPLKFSFVRGSGDLVTNLRTDRAGFARSRLSKITAIDKIQIVKAEVDLVSAAENDTSNRIIRVILNNLTIPNARVILNITGLTVYLQSSEKNLGKPLDVLSITPRIKNWLSQRGFTFVDDIGNADFMIELVAASRQGSKMFGQYAAYVDLEITAIDLATGEELFSDAMTNIKGMQLNYDKAGMEAFDNTFDKLKEELLPKFVNSIHK